MEKILPLIRREIPEVQFTVVGENPSRKIKNLHGKGGVRVTGRVPDVRSYINQASVYVLPLTIGSGVRVKLFEALAMAIPVVAFRSACEGHQVSHGEDILIAETPEAFAGHVLKLLRDRPLSERMGAEARTRVLARHSWKHSGEILEAALVSLNSTSGAPN